MSAVGTGAEIGIHPRLGLEQSRARDRAGGESRRGRDRRRHARQRRQPARLRGPQRAAARQGQGQQRVLRHRPVHPPVRRAASPSTTCVAPRSSCAVEGADGFRLEGTSSMSRDQPRSRWIWCARRSARAPVPRRLRAVPRHDVRARPRTATSRAAASPTRSATSSRISSPRLGPLVNRVTTSRRRAALDLRRPAR